MQQLMIETGVLDTPLAFDEFVDVQFAEQAVDQKAWSFGAGNQDPP